MSTLAPAAPPITREEVFRRHREHFTALHASKMPAEVRAALPNTKRKHYRLYAGTSQTDRTAIAADMADISDRYFRETQPDGYVTEYRKPARRPKLRTLNACQSLELLTDYLLAEDHSKGLSLRDKAKIEAGEDEEYPPLGAGARAFLGYSYYLECIGEGLSEKERRRLKVCETCRCEFIDTSPAINALVCGDKCRLKKDAIRKRVERNDDDRLKRYRERQAQEYPFYSPVELYERTTRGESVRGDVIEAADRARIKQERGKRKPTNVTMDLDRQYYPNNHKRWRSQKEGKELSGEVVTYNLHDQPLTEEWKSCRHLGHLSL
ncbi:hypothetical protein [Paenibacillus sp. HGF5]|uniref:hypothetical protein n=1 Tax=Paenibacillus sp. HGF5 TaxID=908341 RepID=UPI0002072D63|nr:hypothetical protein [Paenibacillus sp. HGF5]EGG35252.1 hypothetical protein HMPREF9412_3209 [Paenibacillus sp. HGF5]